MGGTYRPCHPRPVRISVVGSSGSGKTTLAARLGAALGCEHVELDAINHQPGWTPREPAAFLREVGERCPVGGAWVVEGNYSHVRPLVWSRADLVVWLDPPTWRTMTQLVRRTLVRGALRRELWNGNRESLRNLLRTDPAENVVLWSWTRRHLIRRRYLEAMITPPEPGLRVVRICRPEEADALVEALARAEAGSGRRPHISP